MKYYLRLLAFPLFFLVLFATLNLMWGLFNIDPVALARTISDWFESYGLSVLFLSSIVEGALLIGGYFPGVFVIFIGVIFANSIRSAVLAVVVVSVGLQLAHLINYALGKYGWYKLLVKFGMKNAVEQAEEKLKKRGPIAILASYWMPSIGALTDTAAGIIRLPFRIFVTYSVLSTIIWNTIVGTAVYLVGETALQFAAPSGPRSLVIYGVILIWVVALILADRWEKEDKNQTTPVG